MEAGGLCSPQLYSHKKGPALLRRNNSDKSY
jgi:hypothetical protein